MNGEAGSRFIHEPGVIDFARSLVAEYDKHQRHEDREWRNKNPLWNAWIMMKSRCLNPRATDYRNHGGRGIKVCDRWMDAPHGFKNFLSDMSPRPQGQTLDRIDHDGDFTPDNCRWVTPSDGG